MSQIALALGTGCSLIIESSSLHCFGWRSFKKPVPLLALAALLSAVVYDLSSLVNYTEECAGPPAVEGDGGEEAEQTPCALGMELIAIFMDWITSTTLDLAYILRMRAVLISNRNRKLILIFTSVSILYGIANICELVGMAGHLDESIVNDIWASFNVVMVFNQLLMHVGLIHALTRGVLARRASNRVEERTWLARLLLFTTIFYLGATISCYFEEDLGSVIVDVSWAVNIKAFTLVSAFMEKIMEAGQGGGLISKPLSALTGAQSPSTTQGSRGTVIAVLPAPLSTSKRSTT